jgi:hypothetical protein
MGMNNHAKQIFKLEKSALPLDRMLLCGIATGIPLLLGWWLNQIGPAIYGGLMGYLMALNDSPGSLLRKITHMSVVFTVFFLSLFAGTALYGHLSIAVVVFAILSYGIGIMGSRGTEFERMMLFACFLLLSGMYSSSLSQSIEPILYTSLFSFTVVIAASIGLFYLIPTIRESPTAYFSTLRTLFTTERSRHIYAFVLAFTVVASLMTVSRLEIERGYWAVGTVFLVMLPDRRLSIYRSVQRLLGTVLGVAIATITVHYIRDVRILIFLVTLSSFLVPGSLKRNYGITSLLAAFIVLILLDLPATHTDGLALAFLRLKATALGCGLIVLSIALWKILEFLVPKKAPDKRLN